MDHKELLEKMLARIDRLEDRVVQRIDRIDHQLSDHTSRISRLETHQGWVIKIGTALIVGAWTAIVTIYKTL